MHCRSVPLGFPAMGRPAAVPTGTAWARLKQNRGGPASVLDWSLLHGRLGQPEIMNTQITTPRPPGTVAPENADAYSLYHTDPYTWSQQQLEALRRQDYDAIDLEHVIEEIEDVGGRHRDRLQSHYARVLQHFLKLQYRHPSNSDSDRGWQNTIKQARRAIHTVLRRSPGLDNHKEPILAAAWQDARHEAIDAFTTWQTARMTDLRAARREEKRLTREWNLILPLDNPYTLHQVHSDFWCPEPTPLPQRPTSPATSPPAQGWKR